MTGWRLRLRLWPWDAGGAEHAPALPQRVQRELAREQLLGELLVTLVQVALVVSLALLYAATPEGFSPDAPIEAAPLGLCFFAILALLRLYAAWTGQLTRPLMAVAVVAEMAVLLGVIWAYHLQYEQPAQFSLKSTQFVYVFALIALRALRFEPDWVLLSGCTAAVGWILLVLFTLRQADANPVTWDAVTSLRSLQIHPGGEFDKVLAILLVTGVLALALVRARRVLERAVSQRRAAADLALFFDDAVARRITASEQDVMAGQGELREASVVFLDLRGFTAASRQSTPTELIALLGEYQRLAVPLLQRHGGSIDKFLGDGILASFGAVVPDRHHAANALRAIDAVLAQVVTWRDGRRSSGQIAPDVGAGVAHGPVVFGIIGGERRLEYTVIGDAVNLAAKLEKHNKVEHTRALTTRCTYELARQQGYAGEKPLLDARAVAGTAAPLDLAVLGVST